MLLGAEAALEGGSKAVHDLPRAMDQACPEEAAGEGKPKVRATRAAP